MPWSTWWPPWINVIVIIYPLRFLGGDAKARPNLIHHPGSHEMSESDRSRLTPAMSIIARDLLKPLGLLRLALTPLLSSITAGESPLLYVSSKRLSEASVLSHNTTVIFMADNIGPQNPKPCRMGARATHLGQTPPEANARYPMALHCRIFKPNGLIL